MPPATIATPNPQAPPPARVVPFIRATIEHTEPAFDVSTVISANAVSLGPYEVPAYGYLRSILLHVQATGGTGAAATYEEDAPWTALSEIVISDVNGAPIFGPLSGYEAYLASKWLPGYGFETDALVSPAYVTPATTGNFEWMLRIPIEISSRDGLGSLPNMNASSTYRVKLTQAAATDTYIVNPTTLPTLRVRGYLEAYAPPSAVSGSGAPQAVQPPALGTTQYWTRYVENVSAGSQTFRLRRAGNLLRGLIVILRTAAPARSATMFPDPFRFSWDGRTILNEGRDVRRNYMRERSGYAPETGVLCFDFAHEFDGKVGGELRDGWLPTVQSSRLEFEGVFGAAGTMTVLTNDVAPVGDVFLG